MVALAEFELIRRYFAQAELAFERAGVVLGPGDDCALLELPPGCQLALSIDTLNEGVHFPAGADPYQLGQRCLLVNLSDLAAMGAEPLGFTLALSLLVADEQWLAAFSRGLAGVARQYQCSLLGGDTTRGPLAISIQVHGQVPAGQALRRTGAKSGDAIYVTGTLGDAAAALRWMQNDTGFVTAGMSAGSEEFLRQAFYSPPARVQAGMALRGLASAALDLSDGLASDLQHILSASRDNDNACEAESVRIGAVIDEDKLPLSEVFRRHIRADQQLALALGGGDDYELCVTLPPANEQQAVMALREAGVQFTRIGEIDSGEGIRLRSSEGKLRALALKGYQHFGEH